MKFANYIKASVFAKEDEDINKIKNTLLSLFPFDLAKEKIDLIKSTALGLNEKKIIIFKITIDKDKHIHSFLKSFCEKCSADQKALLLNQAESRLDSELNFFIRLDKDKLINENRFWITDRGDCFHIKISIVSFPKKREIALKVINTLFK